MTGQNERPSDPAGADRDTVTMLAQRADIDLTPDEIAMIAGAQRRNLEGLAQLRAVLRPEDEPALTFSRPVGLEER